MKNEFDCSLGEGGGSIVRISTAIAAATDASLRLTNIRSGRSNPGLRVQHIEAIRAIQQLSGISVDGLEIGSQMLNIAPGKQKKSSASVFIRTAGSTALVAQAAMYFAITQDKELDLQIRGGATHTKWAPSVEYIENITHNFMQKMNKNINIKINKYGFYPKGGADCVFSFKKHDKLHSIDFTERGELEEIIVFSIASKNLENRQVAERQYKSLLENINPSVSVEPRLIYVNSLNPGTGLTVINKYSSGTNMGCFVVGEKRISAEFVGKLCSKEWKENEESFAAVDEYAADQLIIPLSLVNDNSRFTTTKISKHTQTNIELAEKFTNSTIDVSKEQDHYLIRIGKKDSKTYS